MKRENENLEIVKLKRAALSVRKTFGQHCDLTDASWLLSVTNARFGNRRMQDQRLLMSLSNCMKIDSYNSFARLHETHDCQRVTLKTAVMACERFEKRPHILYSQSEISSLVGSYCSDPSSAKCREAFALHCAQMSVSTFSKLFELQTT